MAAGGEGYWHANYFHTNYWHVNYWAEFVAGIVAAIRIHRKKWSRSST